MNMVDRIKHRLKHKCDIPWCFKEYVGFVRIYHDDYLDKQEKIPYCDYHGEIAQDVIQKEFS